jgi:hypothetical protein
MHLKHRREAMNTVTALSLHRFVTIELYQDLAKRYGYQTARTTYIVLSNLQNQHITKKELPKSVLEEIGKALWTLNR